MPRRLAWAILLGASCVSPPLDPDSHGSGDEGQDSTLGATSERRFTEGGDTDGATSAGSTPSTGAPPDGDTGTTDGGERETGTETGPTDPPPDPDPDLGNECRGACVAGCETTLAEGYLQPAELWMSGDRLLSHSPVEKKTILWDRSTRTPMRIERGFTAAGLGGGLFFVADAQSMRWFDVDDGELLGETEAGAARGVASDGAYLWVASADGLRLFDSSGADMLFVPGDFAPAKVHALTDTVHVSAPDMAVGTVLQIDVATGAIDSIPHTGTLTAWFVDSGRFITTQGDTFQIRDEDGAPLVFDFGWVAFAAGDYYLGADDALRSVWAPDTIVTEVAQPRARSGNALLGLGELGILVEVEGDVVTVTEQAPACCPLPWAHGFRIGYEAGSWAISSQDGLLAESTGESYSRGHLEHVDASRSGRIVASSALGPMYVWDVDATCDIVETGELDRSPTSILLADDGEALLVLEHDADSSPPGWGVHVLSMPDGQSLGFVPGGEPSLQMSTSDSADILGRHWWAPTGELWDPGIHGAVTTFPDLVEWFDFEARLPIRVAPGGAHAIGVDANDLALFPAYSYLVDSTGVVGVFDGAVFGFLDDAHVLVGDYDVALCAPTCDTYLGSRIVTLDGALVSETDLPAAPGFRRVTDTEIFVADPPRIYDAYEGSLSWSGEDAEVEVRVGADFVVTSDGANLVLRKWR